MTAGVASKIKSKESATHQAGVRVAGVASQAKGMESATHQVGVEREK